MIPRTYDALATLGLHTGMHAQKKLIDEANKKDPPYVTTPKSMPPDQKEIPVATHANSIDKPDMGRLERDYRVKACVAMLYACGEDSGRWRYREIYIHSKLMIVDDLFLTLGSANLNHRSMAVDSEINISMIDPGQAKVLRKKIWRGLAGEEADGGEGSKEEIKAAFKTWGTIMEKNKDKVLAKTHAVKTRKLVGHILRLEDKRSSVMRLG